MLKQKENFVSSLKELKVTRNVVICGLMAALAVALRFVATIEIGPYIRVGFQMLPNRVVEYLFGPVVGCLFGGMLDILNFIVKPTGAFFPGFTFDAMLSGLIYGIFYYKKPISIKRILIAEFLVKLIVYCGFNTLWISMLYGKAFMAILPLRALKNLIMWPIDSAITFFLFKLVNRIKAQIGME